MAGKIVVSIPDDQLIDLLGVAASGAAPSAEDVTFITWDMTTPPPVPQIDIVVPPYQQGVGSLPALASLATPPALVQWQSIGFDGVSEALPPGQTVANATSVHETSTAELAVTLILAAQRQLPRFVEAQARGEWQQRFVESLADRRVLLLGYGGVGKAIARRLEPFEVSLTAVASHERDEPNGQHVYAMDALPRLLPDAEIVVVVLPGNDATRGIVGKSFLAALPDGALVVNVGRGPAIDTEAMLAETTRLRFALDVTEPEPLPAGHSLFAAPSVLITPHVGGLSSAMQPRMARLLLRQIEHYRLHEPFENIVLRS